MSQNSQTRLIECLYEFNGRNTLSKLVLSIKSHGVTLMYEIGFIVDTSTMADQSWPVPFKAHEWNNKLELARHNAEFLFLRKQVELNILPTL